MAADGFPFLSAVSAARAYRPASMLPPHPLPEVPQGIPPPPPLAAGCPRVLFCLVCAFCFCSCGLPLSSNVCVQPSVTGNREQKSARRKRFFFTGPPFLRVETNSWAPGSTTLLEQREQTHRSMRQQLCSHVESRCHFSVWGFL